MITTVTATETASKINITTTIGTIVPAPTARESAVDSLWTTVVWLPNVPLLVVVLCSFSVVTGTTLPIVVATLVFVSARIIVEQNKEKRFP